MLTFPQVLRVSLFVLLLLIAARQISAKKQIKYKLRRWESTGIVNCTVFEFSCKNDSTHILPLSKRCDGEAQCKDKSDEQKCTECRTPYSVNGSDGFLQCLTPDEMRMEDRTWRHYRDDMYPTCPKDTARDVLKKRMRNGCFEHEFRCPSEKTCLQQRSVCDGVRDCYYEREYKKCEGDYYGSYVYTYPDENNCTECKGGAKLCEVDNKCIRPALLCNGDNDCSDGSDEENCTTTTLTCARCSGNRALCGNGQCIDANKVCDGKLDCTDASDEQNCPTSCGAVITNRTEMPKIVEIRSDRYLQSEVCKGLAPSAPHDYYSYEYNKCPDGECDCRFTFECDGKCIPKATVCDGSKDCSHSYYYGGTSEDEKHCLKACQMVPFFTRLNKAVSKCVSQAHVCDGVYDFADGSDEKKCKTCPSDAHKCDGGCLPSYLRCDGKKDCKDGSDEAKCSCEECITGRLDTYSCEATGKCMKRSAACGPHSLCPQPTARDELFCVRQSKRGGSRHWD